MYWRRVKKVYLFYESIFTALWHSGHYSFASGHSSLTCFLISSMVLSFWELHLHFAFKPGQEPRWDWRSSSLKFLCLMLVEHRWMTCRELTMPLVRLCRIPTNTLEGSLLEWLQWGHLIWPFLIIVSSSEESSTTSNSNLAYLLSSAMQVKQTN